MRSFPDWTMGFNRISDEDIATIEGFSDFWRRPTSDFFSNSPSEIEKLLDMFKHETLFWIAFIAIFPTYPTVVYIWYKLALISDAVFPSFSMNV